MDGMSIGSVISVLFTTLKCSMHTVCTQYAHSMHTVCTQYAHGMRAYILYVCAYTCTYIRTCSLNICSICTHMHVRTYVHVV